MESETIKIIIIAYKIGIIDFLNARYNAMT